MPESTQDESDDGCFPSLEEAEKLQGYPKEPPPLSSFRTPEGQLQRRNLEHAPKRHGVICYMTKNSTSETASSLAKTCCAQLPIHGKRFVCHARRLTQAMGSGGRVIPQTRPVPSPHTEAAAVLHCTLARSVQMTAARRPTPVAQGKV